MQIGSIKKKQYVGIFLLRLCWEYLLYKLLTFFLFPYLTETKAKIEIKHKMKNNRLILPSFRTISKMTPVIGSSTNINTHDKYKMLFNIAGSCFTLYALYILKNI